VQFGFISTSVKIQPPPNGYRKSERIVTGNTGENVKLTLNIVGSALVLFGAIWFLQGINVLPGSFMTGQIRWAVCGGIAVAAGVALLLTARRRRSYRG